MKKILSIGLLSLCALAITERQAEAWVNAKFSIGLNWSLQSGNNNILWGVFKNGQVPGPEAFGGGGPFQYGPFTAPAGQSMPFPFYGAAPQTMPQAAPVAQQQTYYHPQNYGYNPYQTVSYQPNGYYYPSQFYPTYYQAYSYQAPYYWYPGR